MPALVRGSEQADQTRARGQEQQGKCCSGNQRRDPRMKHQHNIMVDSRGETGLDPSLLRSIRTGTIARTIGTGVGITGGVLTTAFAVRLLSLRDYGYLAFLMSAVATATAFVSAFTMNGISRETSLRAARQDGDIKDLGRGALAMSLIGGLLMFGVLLSIAASRRSLDPSTRLVAGLALGMMAFATTHGLLASSLARGLSRFAIMEFPPLMVVIGRLSVVFALTLAGRADLRNVLVGYGLVAVVCLCIAQVVISSLAGGRRGWLKPSIAAGRRLFALTLPYAMAGMGVLVIAWADVLVLGFAHPAEEVARYEPVLRMTDRLMLLVPNLFAGSFLPVATRLYERGLIESFGTMFRLISRYVFTLSVPFLILLIAYPETVIRALYGSDFPSRPALVWVLLFGYVINLVTGMNYLAIGATGDRKLVMRPALIAAGVMIVLAVTLIPPFGPLGAALATSLSFLALNVLVSIALLEKTGVHPFDKQLFKVITTSLLPIGVAILLHSRGFGETIWTALGLSGILWAMWVGLLALMRSLDLDLFRRLPRSADD